MVNIAIINENSVKKDVVNKTKELLNKVFKSTQEVNAHVFFNLKSPIDSIGVYNYLFFIEIPFRKGNYYRTQKGVYLNNIVFAIRKITDKSITEVNNDGTMFTKNGMFDYSKQISEETKALKQFIRENISGVKFANLALYYVLEAQNCSSKGIFGNILCNIGCPLEQLVTYTVDNLHTVDKSKGTKRTNCLCFDKIVSFGNVINSFIEVSEARTNQGILTKKKMDAISTKEIGKQMLALYNIAGKKEGIIAGKAGTGKTLALLRFMYNHVQNHHCRLLTYNNLLVMDLQMTIRNFGKITPTNASISTLHKFFYQIYDNTPVKFLHMDESQINRLFGSCLHKVLTMVFLVEEYTNEHGFTTDTKLILDYYEKNERIKGTEKKEMKLFSKYLSTHDWSSNKDLETIAKKYVQEKREKFIHEYGKNAFISGYRIILEQIYLLLHYSNEFLIKYGKAAAMSSMVIRQTEQYKKEFSILYDNFIFCVVML